MKNILNEIYILYEQALDEASAMWKSEYCYSKEEEDKRDKDDQEQLEYFKILLQNINNLYENK